MIDLTHEKLAELAFALIGNAPPVPNQESLLDCIRQDSHNKRILSDYIQILRGMNQETTPDVEPLDEELVAAYVDGSLPESMREQAETLFSRSCRARPLWIDLIQTLHDGEEMKKVRDLGLEKSSVLTFVVALVQKGIQLLAHPENGFSLASAQPVMVLGGTPENNTDAPKICEWNQQLGNLVLNVRLTYGDDQHAYLNLGFPSTSEGSQVTLYVADQILQSEYISSNHRVVFDRLKSDRYRIEITPPAPLEVTSFLLDIQSPHAEI